MVYSFELIKHANIRYREAVLRIARCELDTMLRKLSIFSDLHEERLGGSVFLTFDCRELSAEEILYLSGHSSVAFMAENQKGLLRPLTVRYTGYLPEDLPEVLKYKGKTSASFTRMMINTALALTPFSQSAEDLVFFDPVCGKGTGCFCAVTAGISAVGIDCDQRSVEEAAKYFSNYLQYHKLKHRISTRSETIHSHPVPVTEFTFSDTKEHFLSGRTRSLSLCPADTLDSPVLFRHRKAHLIAADLPYGIQHAPRASGKPVPLHQFLRDALPVWKKVLLPGGTIAVSFNTLTLPTPDVLSALKDAGFIPEHGGNFSNLKHEVEHAVVRDVIFAVNP